MQFEMTQWPAHGMTMAECFDIAMSCQRQVPRLPPRPPGVPDHAVAIFTGDINSVAVTAARYIKACQVVDGGVQQLREGLKVGRNEPCPCGKTKKRGKEWVPVKFKHCHQKTYRMAGLIP